LLAFCRSLLLVMGFWLEYEYCYNVKMSDHISLFHKYLDCSVHVNEAQLLAYSQSFIGTNRKGVHKLDCTISHPVFSCHSKWKFWLDDRKYFFYSICSFFLLWYRMRNFPMCIIRLFHSLRRESCLRFHKWRKASPHFPSIFVWKQANQQQHCAMYRNCDLLFNFEKLKSFPFNLFIFGMYVYVL
jgi:hypothetical protein